MFQEVFIILLTDFWLTRKWSNEYGIYSISPCHRKQREMVMIMKNIACS